MTKYLRSSTRHFEEGAAFYSPTTHAGGESEKFEALFLSVSVSAVTAFRLHGVGHLSDIMNIFRWSPTESV